MCAVSSEPDSPIASLSRRSLSLAEFIHTTHRGNGMGGKEQRARFGDETEWNGDGNNVE